jgi:addiction module HigA family antidote
MPVRAVKRLPPIHPGEVLREEFLKPMSLSAHQFALALRVPATRVNEIVNERRGITADTAMRLARYFGTSAKFWINLQAAYDLDLAEGRFSETVDREVLSRPENRGRSTHSPFPSAA